MTGRILVIVLVWAIPQVPLPVALIVTLIALLV